VVNVYRIQILLLTRMTKVLLLMILEETILMPVRVAMRKRHVVFFLAFVTFVVLLYSYIYGVSDTLMMANFQKPVKKEIKKDLPPKASTSKKKPKDDEDGKKKKQKKKKDPNAPKRAMSGFMFFSKLEREVCSVLSLILLYIHEPWMNCN